MHEKPSTDEIPQYSRYRAEPSIASERISVNSTSQLDSNQLSGSSAKLIPFVGRFFSSTCCGSVCVSRLGPQGRFRSRVADIIGWIVFRIAGNVADIGALQAGQRRYPAPRRDAAHAARPTTRTRGVNYNCWPVQGPHNGQSLDAANVMPLMHAGTNQPTSRPRMLAAGVEDCRHSGSPNVGPRRTRQDNDYRLEWLTEAVAPSIGRPVGPPISASSVQGRRSQRPCIIRPRSAGRTASRCHGTARPFRRQNIRTRAA